MRWCRDFRCGVSGVCWEAAGGNRRDAGVSPLPHAMRLCGSGRDDGVGDGMTGFDAGGSPLRIAMTDLLMVMGRDDGLGVVGCECMDGSRLGVPPPPKGGVRVHAVLRYSTNNPGTGHAAGSAVACTPGTSNETSSLRSLPPPAILPKPKRYVL